MGREGKQALSNHPRFSRKRNGLASTLPDLSDSPLGQNLQQNLSQIKTDLGSASDLVIRPFRMGAQGQHEAAVVFVEGLADASVVDDFILRSLTAGGGQDQEQKSGQTSTLSPAQIKEQLLTVAEVEEATSMGQVLDAVLNGKTALLIDQEPTALLASTVGWKTRAITETSVEGVVRGSREGFTEDLVTSVSAVRRRIRHPSLRVEQITLGTLSRTRIAVLHVDGIARPEVIQEVRTRLSGIQIDGILESGYIEELIEDHRFSPFPQMEHTERPDKVAGALLEGRVAIITDGTPAVLLVPVGLAQFLQASEDYFERYPFAITVRFLRFLALLIALYLPSLYIAIITYHQEMIPMELVLRIAASREGTPFPAFFEALIMEGAFELLREASIRLPQTIGQAISIVGGLVIGDAAVRAGLVSPPMVIVVATTGIASFAIPAFNLAMSLRFLRFGIMTVAAVLGLPGITLAGMAMTYHLASLRSFGMPYLSPIAPGKLKDWKDVLIRAPWWGLRQRPSALAVDLARQPASRSSFQRRPRR